MRIYLCVGLCVLHKYRQENEVRQRRLPNINCRFTRCLHVCQFTAWSRVRHPAPSWPWLQSECVCVCGGTGANTRALLAKHEHRREPSAWVFDTKPQGPCKRTYIYVLWSYRSHVTHIDHRPKCMLIGDVDVGSCVCVLYAHSCRFD